MQNFKQYLKEQSMPEYKGNITVPKSWKDLSKLPELFPGYTPGCKVIGNFDCQNCKNLTSLEGGPSIVVGYVQLLNCKSLTTLEGGPKEVGKFFECANCASLTSLEGAPEKVGAHFGCNKCANLTSLKGCPKIISSFFDCSYCTSLTSLEGAPMEVNMFFNTIKCTSLESLKGIGKDYLLKLKGDLNLQNCSNLKSNVLGLLKIKEIDHVDFSNPQVKHFKNLQKIIDKYLKRKDLLGCQDELIENGFSQYAKL
jgi:hypothetical protein